MNEYNFGSNTYSLLYILITCLGIYVTGYQIQHSDTSAKTTKISFYFTALLCASDCYISMIHFVLSTQMNQINTCLMILAFLNFILFSFFDLRFMLIVWKSHLDPSIYIYNILDDSVDLRQRILGLYLKFYIFLCSGFFFSHFKIVIYVYSFFLFSPFIFQIIRAAKNNYRRKLITNRFLYGIALSRIFLTYYFTIYSNSIRVIIFGNSYYYKIGTLLISYILFQVIIVKCQEKYGPRFFIPSFLLSQVYNYHRIIPDVY